MSFARANGRAELRAGVVGAGVFGRHHAAKYAQRSDVTLAGIADISPENRARTAFEHGVPAHADWRDLIGRVDLVSVCSPASTHAEIVRGFLTAGVHVLVEKPIATRLEEAEGLIALAEANDLVLTVGHQERFVFSKIGLFGRRDAPLALECTRTGPWTGRGGDVSVVLDLMIHDLDLVHSLVPSHVADVAARGRSVHGLPRDEVAAELCFANGTRASFFASRAADTRRRLVRALYAVGTIEIDFLSRSVRNTTGAPLAPLDLADPLGESVGAFIAAVRDGVPAPVCPEQARRALETALLIDEAAQPAHEALFGGAVALSA